MIMKIRLETCTKSQIVNKLEDENPMPLTESPPDLPDKFADFFLNKIEKIREQFHK